MALTAEQLKEALGLILGSPDHLKMLKSHLANFDDAGQFVPKGQAKGTAKSSGKYDHLPPGIAAMAEEVDNQLAKPGGAYPPGAIAG